MKRDLLLAEKAVVDAEKIFESVIRRELPVGEPTAWIYNGRHQGVVVAHGYKTRIKVRNNATSKEYWIDVTDIIRALQS
jgi:hypothetical protein